MTKYQTQIAIIGAGIAGISTAYYLAADYGITNVLLIDAGQPMAFTSAQSGDNYRNWWPHPSMVAFTNHSIDLMEEIARNSDNRINMNRRGYVLATRRTEIGELMAQLHQGFGDISACQLRIHDKPGSSTYTLPSHTDWDSFPDGIDILQDKNLIRQNFPTFSPEIQTVIHIRRGGDINGQQLGMYMFEYFRNAGGRYLNANVKDISCSEHYSLRIYSAEEHQSVEAEKLVNAAGPFAGAIAAMLDVNLPIYNSFQQKITFEDKAKAIPRNLPFSIDLDPQYIDWSNEEREILLDDDEYCWLAKEMPGAIHCRPDGGENSSWIKLGWAYNRSPGHATWEPPLDDQFPEIVLRGAARLNPALKSYYGRLPRNRHHYGGWYTMTEENWPLIGPMGPAGAYINCALSGFGTMAACASGKLCAAWIAQSQPRQFAKDFSLCRYKDKALMKLLYSSGKGVL